MKFSLLIWVLIPLSFLGSAQENFNKTWYSGGGRTFRSQFTTSGVVNTKVDSTHGRYFSTGSSSICDSNGNIILCSDGFSVYGADLEYLDGGYRLMDSAIFDFYNGFSILSQSSIFLPIDDTTTYFVNSGTSEFNLNTVWLAPNSKKAPFDLLFLNKINMKANGGAGKVVERMKPIVQGEFISKTQMMACKHANGKDWWLLKMMHDSVSVYTFLITKDSVYNYGKQSFPYPRKTGTNNGY
ncbi:MAG: hypothetical protein IPN26_16505 [Bacteroidetes bacterium]|nr:hypothetical protein [Bacteroidota bacterium]